MNGSSLRKMTPKELKRLLDRGIVDVMVTPTLQAYDDVNDIPVTALPEFEPFKKLLGKPITMSAAARKYRLRVQTISGWVARLNIPRIGTGPHGAVLIDEAYIAYFARRYKTLKPGPGRRTDRLF
jgi:hypothetical protein